MRRRMRLIDPPNEAETKIELVAALLETLREGVLIEGTPV